MTALLQLIMVKQLLFLQMKNILVIGGGGFLGRHITEHLLDRGFKVHVFDIRSTFDDERITYFCGDLCNQEVSSKPIKIFFLCITLKLHNCFVYFIQTINPWRMVFYFFILLLRLLSY